MITVFDLGPSKRTYQLAAALMGILALSLVAMVPLANISIGIYPSFQVFFGTSSTACLILTSIILYARARVHRSQASMILASAYLFTAILVAFYIITFPGVVSDTGLLGAGPATSLWLWTFVHSGFPVISIIYVLTDAQERRVGRTPAADTRAVHYILLVVCVCIFPVYISIKQVDRLPRVINGLDYHLYLQSGIGYFVIFVNVAGFLALMAVSRVRTIAQLWMSVTLLGGAYDVIAALMSARRWTVSWYAARIGSLLEATVFLAVLLVQTEYLYRRSVHETPNTGGGG